MSSSDFQNVFKLPIVFLFFLFSNLVRKIGWLFWRFFFSKQDNRNAIPVKISNVKMTIFRLSTSCLLFLFLCLYYLLKLMIFCSRSPQHPHLQLASFVPRCSSLPDKDQVFPFSAAGERPQWTARNGPIRGRRLWLRIIDIHWPTLA